MTNKRGQQMTPLAHCGHSLTRNLDGQCHNNSIRVFKPKRSSIAHSPSALLIQNPCPIEDLITQTICSNRQFLTQATRQDRRRTWPGQHFPSNPSRVAEETVSISDSADDKPQTLEIEDNGRTKSDSKLCHMLINFDLANINESQEEVPTSIECGPRVSNDRQCTPNIFNSSTEGNVHGILTNDIECNDSGHNHLDNRKSETAAAIRLFAERVTVAGVEDLYKTKIPAETVMWCIALLLAIIGALITSCSITEKYLNPTVVYNDFLQFNAQAPFPNVTVCISAANNRTKLREKLVIPEKTVKLLKRNNISLDDVIENFVLDIWRLDFKHLNYTYGVKAQAGLQIIDATAPGSVFNTLKETFPACEDLLSECYFEGTKFDCCQAANYQLVDGYVCYFMSLPLLPEFNSSTAVIGGSAADPIQEAKSGLSFNISINWQLANFYDDLSSDGMLLMLGESGSIYGDPVAVPAYADVKIKLAVAKQLVESSECQNPDNLPQLQYYDYYDPYGRNCMIDTWLSLLFPHVGCDMVFSDHVPKSGMECAASIPLSISTLGFNTIGVNDYDRGDAASNMLREGSLINMSVEVKRVMGEYWDLWDKIGTPGKVLKTLCQPLCTRWQYPVLSASYGFITDQTQPAWERPQNETVSWSRVQVYFPDAYYKQHTEKQAAPSYMVMCDVGGVFGVYLGFSMVTVIQLFAYAGYITAVYGTTRKIRK